MPSCLHSGVFIIKRRKLPFEKLCKVMSYNVQNWKLKAFLHSNLNVQVCRQLYEVMTELSEQHSDKVFTIQGAPRSV